jgi:hypothetical protein
MIYVNILSIARIESEMMYSIECAMWSHMLCLSEESFGKLSQVLFAFKNANKDLMMS